VAHERDSTVEIFLVDAFTSDRFKGNPAGVCMPEDRLPEKVCQDIAAELNLSETAFIHPVERTADDIPRFGLRWFTPMKEVELCGHATLATAKVIFQEVGVDSEVLAFDTRSGPLYAHRIGSAVKIDLPKSPLKPAKAPKGLLDTLGPGAGTPKNIEIATMGRGKLLVELEDESKVRNLAPDFKALRAIKGDPPFDGLIVTAKDGKGLDREGSERPDFVSRYFAPWVGVDEDPVTGAAHCALGPYWAKRLGRNQLKAHQLSARGGELQVKVEDERVHLIGEAVVVLTGTMRLD
jgi:PhzF family phenazine biosynthesis protein